MTYAYICREVARLKKRFPDARTVYDLANCLKVIINYLPLGNEPDSIKGFYLYNCRKHVITINSDLPEIIQRIILAHELGHLVLHKDRGVKCFHEITLFDESSTMEKDANLFGAEYLLSDEDVIDLLNSDCTFFTAAATLNVPAEMLDFKFRLMKWKGYKMVEAPINARSNFLKDVEIPENHDFDYA